MNETKKLILKNKTDKPPERLIRIKRQENINHQNLERNELSQQILKPLKKIIRKQYKHFIHSLFNNLEALGQFLVIENHKPLKFNQDERDNLNSPTNNKKTLIF